MKNNIILRDLKYKKFERKHPHFRDIKNEFCKVIRNHGNENATLIIFFDLSVLCMICSFNIIKKR